MKYFVIAPLDKHENLWLFGYDDMKTGHHLLGRYADLICLNCGKLDEPKALARGIEPSVRIHSPKDARRDLLESDDGLLLVSQRFQQIVEDFGLNGLEFRPLPGDDRFALAIPHRVRTDFARAGLEIHPAYRDTPYNGTPYRTQGERLETPDHRCVHCGRYYEFCFRPCLASMELPKDPFTLFTSDVPYEKQHGEETLLFCSDEARKVLVAYKPRGFEFSDAY